MRAEHGVAAQAMTLKIVGGTPYRTRDVRAVPHLVEHACTNRHAQISVVVSVLEGLAAEEHVVAVEGEELVHGGTLRGDSPAAHPS